MDTQVEDTTAVYAPVIDVRYLKEAYFALGMEFWDAMRSRNYYTAKYQVETMRAIVAAVKPGTPFKAVALKQIEEKQERVDRAIAEAEESDA